MPSMAWADDLLDCSFRGVVFDVVGTRDSFGRAISVAEVPYVDGGTTEDLGGKPRPISLQAVFFGDDYKARLDQLLASLSQPGPGELVHPVFGVIARAQFVSGDVAHQAGEIDSCTVSLEFIESGTPQVFFEDAGVVAVQSKVGSLGDSALDRTAGWLSEIVTAVREAAPFAALADLRQTMLGPVLGFIGQVQGVALSGLDVLSEPRAWARDIAALNNGVIASASFGENLMADWRSVTGMFSRLGTSYGYGASASSSSASPSAWSPGSAPTEAQASAVATTYLSVNNATAQADVAAIVLATEAESPTLSPAEIEAVVNTARSEIEAAIMAARAVLVLEQSRDVVETLKDLALAVQLAGQQIIERRPPLLNRTVEASGNLRLIAHFWYGDHSRATELARLNNLRNPNALQKGDVLRAYAQ